MTATEAKAEAEAVADLSAHPERVPLVPTTIIAPAFLRVVCMELRGTTCC